MFKFLLFLVLVTAALAKKKSPEEKIKILQEQINKTRVAYEAEIQEIEGKINSLIEKYNLTRVEPAVNVT